MDKIIYKLPIPSTALWKDVEFEERMQRTFALICEYESETEENKVVLTLLFEQVLAFKATHDWACGIEIIQKAYSKVTDFGNTKWLEEIKNNLELNERDATDLSHLGIYFDDGYAYEFICQGFRSETELKPYD